MDGGEAEVGRRRSEVGSKKCSCGHGRKQGALAGWQHALVVMAYSWVRF